MLYLKYAKFSETLIRGNIGKGYDYLCDLFFDCKNTLTSLILEILIKFSFQLCSDLLSLNFAKTSYFVGDKS